MTCRRLLLIGLLLAVWGPSPGAGQNATTGTSFTLSFVIDGVAYTATCNVTGTAASNCTFILDHGLNVTKLSTTGSTTTEMPVYFPIILFTTMGVVIVLGILMIAGYCMLKQRVDRANAGYGQVPQGYAPQSAESYEAQAGYPTPEYQGPYRGQASQLNAGHKVIQVGLVHPCLPTGAVMVP